ncbi:MAG: patatin-like phospholipase family protein [Candidatus Omnitrophica bacterium]|nr:patatin-like phospholipase family protein [Candidatus Omnitrophota bacterium]
MFNLENILSKFPIFSSLNKDGLKELADIAYLKEFKKSQIIYKDNGQPDNLYIVVFGRIKTYTEASLKEGRILEYLHKGTCFGIISLLTNQPHSVTAEAANDALIALIPKDKFTEFLNHHPLLAVEFSKILSRRVKKRVDKDKNIFESLIISVYSLREKIGNTSYSLALAKALRQESGKNVIVIEIKNKKQGFFFPSSSTILEISQFSESTFDRFLEKRWGIDYLRTDYQSDSTYASKTIPLFLSFLTQIYNFIILDLPTPQDPLTVMSLLQSDFIHLLCYKEPGYLKRLTQTIDSWKNNYKIKEGVIKIIMRGVSANGFFEEKKVHLVKTLIPHRIEPIKNVLATLPRFEETDIAKVIEGYPATAYASAVRRIAREIASVRIGLALGSGAAFAFAHIGVLKVLEEHKIDIDIVSGSSMGSIIAALWGLGKNWRQIKKLVHKFESFPAFSFFDICLSRQSFFRGHNLKKILKELFDNYTFYEFKRPVLLVSFDFLRKEAYVFSQEKFLIREAVLASCSMPGIFEPLKNQEDLFLDGGVLNPLPVGCLVKKEIKKIISVNVTPSKEELQKAYKESPNKKRLNVLDFIFGSIEAMQREFIQDAISFSDVVIHPEFKGAEWTEFKKIDYFIDQGEKAALKHIDKIKQLPAI